MLSQIKNIESKAAELVLSGLLGEAAKIDSTRLAGAELVSKASDYGLSLREYLDYAVTPEQDLTGWETSLKFLGLPVKNSKADIQLSSNTFYSQPGTRLFFPEVLLNIVEWKSKQDQIVTVEPIISQSRSVTGNQVIFMTELDTHEHDALKMFQISEGGEVPIRKIVSSDKNVRFFKLGQGYELTYELARRSAIDMFVPFINRANREFELDKLRHAITLLVNGDGVAGAISVVNETQVGGSNGLLQYKALLLWLVQRAAAGYQIDTLIGNYQTYADYAFMFTPIVTAGGTSEAQALNGLGLGPNLLPGISFMNYNINFVIAPTVAASVIIGITRGECLEELTEVNSDIVENDRVITNQTIRFVRTQNIGYYMPHPLSRQAFSYAA